MVLQPLATRPIIAAPLPPDSYRQPAQPAAAAVSAAWKKCVFEGIEPSKKLLASERRSPVNYKLDITTFRKRCEATAKLLRAADLESEDRGFQSLRTERAAASPDARGVAGRRAEEYSTADEMRASTGRGAKILDLRASAHATLTASADPQLHAAWAEANARRAQAQAVLEAESEKIDLTPRKCTLRGDIAIAEKNLAAATTALSRFAEHGADDGDEEFVRNQLGKLRANVSHAKQVLAGLNDRQAAVRDAAAELEQARADLRRIENEIKIPRNMKFSEAI